MKRTLLLFFAVSMAVAASAQQFVSTTPTNKNVVLEEFTGIYCVYCPDGHKIANQLQLANPGRVVLINVHTGSFAQPSGSDPDFQTTFGASIAGQTGLTGYPAGTINRTVFSGLQQGSAGTTAMSRGNWAAASTQVLAQSSPVNVAAKASIDLQTRVLKVVVETYYTSNSAVSTNKLNVALLQNNVAGPQTGGTDFNPSQVLPNGDYNHQHILRHLLTGQWGLDITTTTTGTFRVDTLTYNIPATINNVAAELSSMEVVVFVAEGQQKILTGAEADMTLIVPDGFAIADLGIQSNATSPQSLCDYNHTPSVLVTNTSTVEVDTFEVSYSLNGGTPVTKMVYQKLAANASKTVTFSPTTLVAGENAISYSVNFADYNYQLLDVTTSNNTTSGGIFYALPAAVAGTKIAADFQNLSIGTEAPNNAIAINPDGIRAYSVDKSVSTAITWNLGGFGLSDGCFRWDYFTIEAGLSSEIVFEKIDLTNVQNAALKFSHAYAQYSNENDRLEVFISNNCGQTWTSIFNKAGNDLETGNAVVTRFYPQINQWVENTVDISAFDGESEIVIKFVGTSDYGNSLYIDDINTTAAVGVQSLESVEAFNVFPNPATSDVVIAFELAQAEALNVQIVNAFGQVIRQVAAQDFAQGQHRLPVSVEALANGTYFVNIYTEGKVVTKKFAVIR